MEYSLEQLKAMANKLGLTTHPNIGSEKLLEKLVDEATEKDTSIEELANQCGFNNPNPVATPVTTTVKPLDESYIERLKNLTFDNAQNKSAKIDEAKQVRDADKLVHCVVTSNDPTKNNHQGEILCGGNSKVSDIKKYVAFNVPYMVPQIILNIMKEKKVQRFKTIKTTNGVPLKKSYTVPAYNIEILPDLTREEFEAIKKRQLADNPDLDE